MLKADWCRGKFSRVCWGSTWFKSHLRCRRLWRIFLFVCPLHECWGSTLWYIWESSFNVRYLPSVWSIVRGITSYLKWCWQVNTQNKLSCVSTVVSLWGSSSKRVIFWLSVRSEKENTYADTTSIHPSTSDLITATKPSDGFSCNFLHHSVVFHMTGP